MSTLFGEQLQVVNVGLPGFAEAIRAAGGTAAQVEWAPPGPGEPLVARRLADLIQHPSIEEANREAYAAYLVAQPVLEAIGPAGRVIPDMGARTILHAGPPIAWKTMCGPMRGAIVGAIALRGLGAGSGRSGRHGRARRDRARALSSARCGRSDGRRDQPLDAGLDRQGPRARQPCVLQPQRGAGQGPALRRERAGGDRAPPLDGRGPGADRGRGASSGSVGSSSSP